MSGRAGGCWWRLVGVAVLLAVAMLPVGFLTLMTLHAVTWTLWDPSGDPPLWLNVLAMTVLVVLAAVPGAGVGRAAGLRRRWLLAAMVLSASVGVGAGVLMSLVAVEEASPLVAAVGSVLGSLGAVVLADRVGEGDALLGDGVAGRPMRSREEKVIAGVCSGWARAHGREPSRVRGLVLVVGVVLAVALPPLTLAVIVAYLYAWLAWPLDATPTPSDPSVVV